MKRVATLLVLTALAGGCQSLQNLNFSGMFETTTDANGKTEVTGSAKIDAQLPPVTAAQITEGNAYDMIRASQDEMRQEAAKTTAPKQTADAIRK